MAIDRTHILVLNHNGRHLLAECLPSLVQAASQAPVPCPVTVIDNTSTDDSVPFLRREWPGVHLVIQPNRGLASFNPVVHGLQEPVVLLLNNDVKLHHSAIQPLLDVFATQDDALFSAPQCWTFDGRQYEGMRTRVRSRFGLVQGLCRVPGFEAKVDHADLTASAGPALAVHRERFLGLGGFDPLYFPGRIEDLDLGFRAWMAGWKGYYVPESLAWHRGLASFGPAFGASGCDRLALRNTLLFCWKNLSGARLLGHLAFLPPRLARSALTGQADFAVALLDAIARIQPTLAARRARHLSRSRWIDRQEAFFKRFAWDS